MEQYEQEDAHKSVVKARGRDAAEESVRGSGLFNNRQIHRGIQADRL